MTYRIRNILVAVGLALLAMMLTLFYVTNYKRSVQRDSSSVSVYVAARDVPAGTAGADMVTQHVLKAVHVARREIVPGAISSPAQIQNVVLAGPLFAGEQVTLRRFTDVAAQGIRAQLKGTLRAVQVAGDPNQLLAGVLQAGDHVDLVANLRVTTNTTETASRIVLRDLTVLTGPTDSALAKVSTGGGSSAILAVSDTQVQRLFFVLKNADWTLELRPVVDAADSAERIETVGSVIKEGLR
ncbi:MAG: Flp pilus assembly protein RcpC/CpaB [Gaiellaceae bacterium]|jgi:Flp pilus assembly protein CpaB|nr:Flp pilus assembly protein RcpC/CpaB [Gaiellaceae bacterium]MDX6472360.1 Flp pilus assembly protein RcpC/CpaB [Gaiellaceae bacterium]